MKTYKIEPKEKIEGGMDKKITIVPEYDRHIEIQGDIYEEFNVNDLLAQIRLIEGQIKNIKRAKENKPNEIKSLFAEMKKYQDKIDEVKKQFSLKLPIPTLKTEKELENELIKSKNVEEGVLL